MTNRQLVDAAITDYERECGNALYKMLREKKHNRDNQIGDGK